jgi:hypothetical protein
MRAASPSRLPKRRAEALAAGLARITREARADGRIASPFAYEGPFRHVMRRALVMRGWRWQPADEAAQLVLAVSFQLLRAERPSWEEGQPDWTRTGPFIQRTRCVNCRRKLPEGHWKFCSELCASSWHHRWRTWLGASEESAAARVARLEL